jgi:hypothetical protein
MLVTAVAAVAVGAAVAQPLTPGGASTQAAPVVKIAISLPKPFAGESATVRWSATGATGCRASGAWSGDKPVAGEAQVGPLTQPGTFRLDCANPSGASGDAVSYTIDPSRPVNSRLGVFDIDCAYSHSLMDDPIVFPGKPFASHLHDFFGFRATDASSTPERMRAVLGDQPTQTTCTELQTRKGDPPAANASAYWVPSMFLNGAKVDAQNLHVYYRNEIPPVLRAFTPGFRMLAGNSTATAEQAKAEGLIRWWCGAQNFSTVDHLPPDCSGRRGIHAEIQFPACWDGRVDSPNHKDHLAYRRDGGGVCPSTHPLRIPRILMHVDFGVYAKLGRTIRSTDVVTLASGGMWTMHADYLFAWDPFRLDFLVHTCLNAKINCKTNPPASTTTTTESATEPPGTTTAPTEAAPDVGGRTKDQSGTTPEPAAVPADSSSIPQLVVLRQSPETPRVGEPFSLDFAVARGSERLETERVSCFAMVEGQRANLVKKEIKEGVASCAWELPQGVPGTLKASLSARVDGADVHKRVDVELA